MIAWQVGPSEGRPTSVRPWWRRPAYVLLGAFLSLLALTAACSKSPTGTTTASAPATATTPPLFSPSTSPSSNPPAASDLSGTWSGQYSGAYQGTFTLTWTQSGSKLNGSIDLASLGGAVPINGTVDGNKISFGTVGSTDITYSGSVSGDSMSGNYQVHAAGGGSSGGPWSATKTS